MARSRRPVQLLAREVFGGQLDVAADSDTGTRAQPGAPAARTGDNAQAEHRQQTCPADGPVPEGRSAGRLQIGGPTGIGRTFRRAKSGAHLASIGCDDLADPVVSR